MFSDPQFWVAIAFIIFIIAIFNPVRKLLTSSLDTKINEIKNNISEAENLKSETLNILSDIKKRQNEVELEIQEIHSNAKEKIKILETKAIDKLNEQTIKKEAINNLKVDQMIRDAKLMIQENISNTALNAVMSILEKKLNDEQRQGLIDSSLKDLNSVLKN